MSLALYHLRGEWPAASCCSLGSNKAKTMPAYSPLRGHPEHIAQACTALATTGRPLMAAFQRATQEMLLLAPSLTRVWVKPCEASLSGTRWQGVPGTKVGTSPKGLLPRVTQPGWHSSGMARGTAQSPHKEGPLAHPSLLTRQPAAKFPVTQTLASEEAAG